MEQRYRYTATRELASGLPVTYPLSTNPFASRRNWIVLRLAMTAVLIPPATAPAPSKRIRIENCLFLDPYRRISGLRIAGQDLRQRLEG